MFSGRMTIGEYLAQLCTFMEIASDISISHDSALPISIGAIFGIQKRTEFRDRQRSPQDRLIVNPKKNPDHL
jgi:hypothetical protein